MRFEARPRLDVEAMLQGNLAVVRDEPIVAISWLTGAASELSADELAVLRRASSAEWLPAAEIAEQAAVDPPVLDGLLRRGLLLGDSDDPEISELRAREEKLEALQWDDLALLYHVTSRHRDLDAGAAAVPPSDAGGEPGPSAEPGAAAREVGFAAGQVIPFAGAASVLATSSGAHGPAPAPGSPPAVGAPGIPGAPGPGLAFHPAPATAPPDLQPHLAIAATLGQQLQATVAQFGPAPHHFHQPPDVSSVHDLPEPGHQGWLLDLLRRRRTTRLYDPASSMTLDELSTVLYYTFGCHGFAPLAAGVVGLKKTSPSGGAMHPVEAYPLILQVHGVPPGLYHYNVQRHALALIRPLALQQGRELATTFTSGQSYYGTAHALFILTARFSRIFWKYRKAQKAYKVVHLDTGHLSQTLYLMATALGLGAFFTGAVNDVNIEQALGLDGVQEGVVGISGCGRPRAEGDALGFETQPYHPRLMQI